MYKHIYITGTFNNYKNVIMPLNEHGEWIRDTSIQELYLYTNSDHIPKVNDSFAQVLHLITLTLELKSYKMDQYHVQCINQMQHQRWVIIVHIKHTKA